MCLVHKLSNFLHYQTLAPIVIGRDHFFQLARERHFSDQTVVRVFEFIDFRRLEPVQRRTHHHIVCEVIELRDIPNDTLSPFCGKTCITEEISLVPIPLWLFLKSRLFLYFLSWYNQISDINLGLFCLLLASVFIDDFFIRQQTLLCHLLAYHFFDSLPAELTFHQLIAISIDLLEILSQGVEKIHF